MTRTGVIEADVVVVGGGVTGIAAAAALADRDFILLEAGDRLGGRLHSLNRGDAWINLGAHVLPGDPTSAVRQLMDAGGVGSIAIPGTKTALWFSGVLHRRSRVEHYPVVLPLTLRERFDLVRAGIRIRLGAERCRLAMRPRRGEQASTRARRLRNHQGERVFEATLRGLSPRVADIFRTAVRRSAGESDQLTVGGALALFAALWVSGPSASVVNVAGGSGRVGEAWRTRLGERAVTGARVASVTEQADHVEVTYVDAHGVNHLVRTGAVIVALPATEAAQVVTDLPDEVRGELQQVAYGPFVCLGILTTDLAPTPWDDVYAIATPGMSFDMLFHHTNPVLAGTASPAPRSLMCYAGGAKAAALLEADHDDITRRFLSQVAEVLPETEGAVAESVLTTWRHGNCYPTPGATTAAAEQWNQRSDARVLLAGDYFAPLGGTADAAAQSGRDAATTLTLTKPRTARRPITNARRTTS